MSLGGFHWPLNIEKELTLKLAADLDQVLQRIEAWRNDEGFRCVTDQSQYKVYRRGSHWHALYTIDIAKVPTEIIVQASEGRLAVVRLILHCHSWWSIAIPDDTWRLEQVLDKLVTYLEHCFA